MRSASRSVTGLILAMLIATSAAAVPTAITTVDTGTCDVLSAPATVEELGFGPTFPAGERIFLVGSAVTATTACASAGDNALVNNLRVSITNLNAIAFSDVYYVANPGTTFTNVDGTINGQLAMKIDTAAGNISLVSEDILSDGIFASGETWSFIVQDYDNATLTVGTFNNIGVPDTNVPPTASGSIVAVPVPEPGTAALLGLGLLAMARRRPR